MRKVAITGKGGFIGDKLISKLSELADVIVLDGDIRDPETFSELDYTYDYLFHFAAPSSQVLFKRQPEYCIDTTINGFLNAKRACEKYGIKLIYPSTGLLSTGEANEYARCKAICEDLAPKDALGLRIFASYGVGESHKRDYASVPYLFARDMVKGKSPIIFGNGEQMRDFIYIDDVANAILVLAEECNDRIVDVGCGESISFNSIVKEINTILPKPVEPTYIQKPDWYVDSTFCDNQRLKEFYKPKITFAEGIQKLVESLK